MGLARQATPSTLHVEIWFSESIKALTVVASNYIKHAKATKSLFVMDYVYLFISVTIYSKSFLHPSESDIYTLSQHCLWPSPHRLGVPTRATLISPRPSRPCVPRLYLPVMFSSARLVHHNGRLCLPSSHWPSPSPSFSLSLPQLGGKLPLWQPNKYKNKLRQVRSMQRGPELLM